MKPTMKSILLLSGFVLIGQTYAADDSDFDRALETLVKDSVSATMASKKQKVAVLEFTDLNGQPSLFGKFLAEQISIGLVLSREQFTVVDRANLKSILSEHKLTEDGLIQPENAKKLGEFSGVDALLIGSATPTPSGYLVTVKVISTDKAEICGAAKGRLPKSSDFDSKESPEKREEVEMTGDKSNVSPEKKETERKAAGFENQYIRVEKGKVQFLKSGEISVSFMVYRAEKCDDREVVARISTGRDFPVYLGPNSTFADQAITTSLHCTDGTDFILTNISGLQFTQEGTDFPSLSGDRPLVATYRFKPGIGRFTSIPQGETLSLNAPVRIFFRSGQGKRYSDAGVTDIHLSEIK